MQIAVVGTGYVGLVVGACLAGVGNDVTCVDHDPAKVELLRRGGIPIYEPGLEAIVQQNVKEGRLHFTTDPAQAIQEAEIIFIAVGTPPGEDGSADLQYVLAVAQTIAQHMQSEKIVICKSTVPVGTCDRVRELIQSQSAHPVHVVSNPEFLKEGSAVRDFQSPDRVIIGSDSDEAARKVANLYMPFMRRSNRILHMGVRSAEMTKYASNSMLATKISFMNEIANLCDAVGADVELVRQGMSMDERIGPHFIFPGAGFGGSCLLGRESVMVRQGGRVRLMTLKALFDQLAPLAKDEPHVIAADAPGVEVLSWLPQDRAPVFRAVSTVTRRGYEGELVEVRTATGRRVSVTTDHPFVVLPHERSDQPQIKLARDLTAQDWLPLGRGLELAEHGPGSLDVLDFLAHAHLLPSTTLVGLGPLGRRALQTLDVEALGAALATVDHAPDHAHLHALRRAGTLRLDEARAADLPLEDAAFGAAFGASLPRQLPLDAPFLRVLGLYMAQGHISGDGARRRVTWCFHPTKAPHLVDEVASFWAQLGVKVDVRQSLNAMQVSVASSLLAGIFQALGAGACGDDHALPSILWSRSPQEQIAFLSGLWHAEGSWSSVRGGSRVILEYGTTSRRLADGIIRMLAAHHVIARLKVGPAPRATRDTYWISIRDADQVEAMRELVSPAERPLVLASLARQSTRVACADTRELGLPGAVAARVTSLARRPFHGMVYSLEVPEAHTFVTSFGLVVHNCFPKDVRALAHLGRRYGKDTSVLEAVERVNTHQKHRLVDMARGFFQDQLQGKRLAVWGLAFKPNTDDVREAPSLLCIRALLQAGASISATDPIAIDAARADLADLGPLAQQLTFEADAYATLKDADALFIFTEWSQYRSPNFARMASLMRSPVIFDGRNLYDPSDVKARGMRYFCIGRATHEGRW